MAELISFDFPVATNSRSSSNLVRFHGVPRRYEETKPVRIQNFTHQRILGIGNHVHRLSLQRLEDEKQQSVDNVEKLVWQQAHKVQEDAIQQVRNEGKQELDRVVKHIIKEQDQKLKEEALKVEMTMQKLSLEQVKEERLHGEKRLLAAVKENEAKCSKQLKLAVQTAREEEIKAAKLTLNKLARKHAAQVEDLKLNYRREKETALEELVLVKDQEKACEIEKVINIEIKKAEQQLYAVQQQHEQELLKIQEIIAEKQTFIKQLENEISKVVHSKEKLQKHLLETREEFQNFIDRMKIFDDGQSDYLLPSLYIEDLN